jgi:hypothetical protein
MYLARTMAQTSDSENLRLASSFYHDRLPLPRRKENFIQTLGVQQSEQTLRYGSSMFLSLLYPADCTKQSCSCLTVFDGIVC